MFYLYIKEYYPATERNGMLIYIHKTNFGTICRQVQPDSEGQISTTPLKTSRLALTDMLVLYEELVKRACLNRYGLCVTGKPERWMGWQQYKTVNVINAIRFTQRLNYMLSIFYHTCTQQKRRSGVATDRASASSSRAWAPQTGPHLIAVYSASLDQYFLSAEGIHLS